MMVTLLYEEGSGSDGNTRYLKNRNILSKDLR
jgi:hypothetical protein